MGLTWTSLHAVIVLLLLTAAVVNDLRSMKVRNPIVLTGFFVGLLYVVIVQGFSGVMMSGLSFLTAAVAVLPLYFMRVLGGGDVKLLLAASVLMDWKTVLITLFASMIWGSLIGIFQVILKGQGRAFAHNMLALAHRAKLNETLVHKIPFTVALLFGYLTSLVWVGGL